MGKKLLFITGTRADFGKLKPLIAAVSEIPGHEAVIFATGMHPLARYGLTVDEIFKTGFRNIHVYINQMYGEPMDLVLANSISGLSRFVREIAPDMLIVHGDRVEALAGAIVGALNNILVAHIEGGEVSGTVDELIRHAVSKLSHLHFVANDEAASRLKQMGELPETIFTIGSPEIDIMLSPELPTLDEVKARYEIAFTDYALLLFHPVTTEIHDMSRQAAELAEAVVESALSYVVVYPNNDTGSDHIFEAYRMFEGNPRFRVFPSLRFEYFLSALRHARFIIGNSSVGVRQAPVYGIPSINIGTRQRNRFHYRSIHNVRCERRAIVDAIEAVRHAPAVDGCLHFGRGESARQFLTIIKGEEVWQTPRQKLFVDIPVLI